MLNVLRGWEMIECGERAVLVGYGALWAMNYRIKKLGLRVCGEDLGKMAQRSIYKAIWKR